LVPGFLARAVLPGPPIKEEPMGTNEDNIGTERVVLLHLLTEDREWWTREQLQAALLEVDPDAVDAALRTMAELGLAVTHGASFAASPGARRVDAMGLIGI
jgi:hypothetical protein